MPRKLDTVDRCPSAVDVKSLIASVIRNEHFSADLAFAL